MSEEPVNIGCRGEGQMSEEPKTNPRPWCAEKSAKNGPSWDTLPTEEKENLILQYFMFLHSEMEKLKNRMNVQAMSFATHTHDASGHVLLPINAASAGLDPESNKMERLPMDLRLITEKVMSLKGAK